MRPMILEGGGSCSEIKLVCRDADNQEIDRINVKLGADEWVEIPEDTRIICAIPVVDLDL
jgi:hypothetical protein